MSADYDAIVIGSGMGGMTIGAGETVKRLLPQQICRQEWAGEVADFKPSICHFEIFLGFEGDIARYGATRSNHWFYESWDTDDAIWPAVARPAEAYKMELKERFPDNCSEIDALQDVMCPGIAGALYGGMLGAAAIDPHVFQRFS